MRNFRYHLLVACLFMFAVFMQTAHSYEHDDLSEQHTECELCLFISTSNSDCYDVNYDFDIEQAALIIFHTLVETPLSSSFSASNPRAPPFH